ncbi:MAG: ABC transporter ATP-binding protein [Methanobacteriota archaeon]|nr:MAG: ABC transporter ATP-binding protein [Euryarchaeota archaeon]
MSSDIAIRVQNITKAYQIYDKPQDRLKQSLWRGRKQFYREFKALDDVSFEVKKGETVGIIGRNGSGKSTLLQIICGTLAPTSGTVEVNGRVAALLELGAGFNPEFTGKENVYMNASILGLSKEEIDARYDDILAFADIGDFINQPVKTYSSGMFVRLAFSVIAHVSADILVIDEALAVGDVFFTQKCMRFLRDFMKQGTVLFVSHDTSAVKNLCRTALWLESGRLRMISDAKTVCEKYLENLYADRQEIHSSVKEEETNDHLIRKDSKSIERVDGRLKYLNRTQYRNDIKIFEFDPDIEHFGDGGASITDVCLLNNELKPMSWIVGGEWVRLKVDALANRDIESVIVGFYVKDRLGQFLFGDNTYLTYHENPVSIAKGIAFQACFDFYMPILPVGLYSFTVAVADGTQEEHLQCCWMHDALVIESISSSRASGLIGIPMCNIEIRRSDPSDEN